MVLYFLLGADYESSHESFLEEELGAPTPKKQEENDVEFIPENLDVNINVNDLIQEESTDRNNSSNLQPIVNVPPPSPPPSTPTNQMTESMPMKLNGQMSKFDIIPVIEEREEMV